MLTGQKENWNFYQQIGDEFVEQFEGNFPILLNGVGSKYFIPDFMTGLCGFGAFLISAL